MIAKQLVGHVDNSAYPAINVDISMTLVVPANAKGPVPVLMMFGRSALPAPTQPSEEDMEKINAKLKALLAKDDPELQAIFEQYPAYSIRSSQVRRFVSFGPRPAGDPPYDAAVDRRWLGLRRDRSREHSGGQRRGDYPKGIIGLVNKGQPRKPDDWGASASLGVGCGARARLSGDRSGGGCEACGDRGRLALWQGGTGDAGVRSALCDGADRFVGKGGTTLLRRNLGEAVESLTGGEYYWMAGNFMKYGASEASVWEQERG